MGVVQGIAMFHREDFILTPIYFLLIVSIAYVIRNFRYSNSPLKKYFIPALVLKLLGGIAVGFIYTFYYKGGDTLYFYWDARSFWVAAQNSIADVFRLIVLPAKTITNETYEYTWWLTYFNRDASSWVIAKFAGIAGLFSFYSYPVISLFFSLISFSGVWALFVMFHDLYPRLIKQIAFSILFIPSVVFWGSGILKDSLTLGFLGWITYLSYQIFFKGSRIVWNIFWLILISYVAIQIKAYVVISFLPALSFWIFLSYRSRIHNQLLRTLLGPVVTIVALVFGFLLVKEIGKEYSQFSVQNVLSTAYSYQQWHGYLSETAHASGYSLGQVNTGSWLSVLSKFPAAVNVSLFRPYLWEASNPVMLISALEAFGILLFTVFILVKNGIVRTLATIYSNPTVLFCIFFAIFFAFAVGFTSYNFGALVRYKIPCIPFYLSGLLILNEITLVARLKRIQERDTLLQRAQLSLDR